MESLISYYYFEESAPNIDHSSKNLHMTYYCGRHTCQTRKYVLNAIAHRTDLRFRK